MHWSTLQGFISTVLSSLPVLQWSRLLSRSAAALTSPSRTTCWFSAVGWKTSTPGTCTWSGPGPTASKSTPSHTSDLSLTAEACTACGVRSSEWWQQATRARPTPAVVTTPASLLKDTKTSCTASVLKVATWNVPLDYVLVALENKSPFLPKCQDAKSLIIEVFINSPCVE